MEKLLTIDDFHIGDIVIWQMNDSQQQRVVTIIKNINGKYIYFPKGILSFAPDGEVNKELCIVWQWGLKCAEYEGYWLVKEIL